MKFKVIILTKDEELHVERCINSVRPIASEIWVIDSYSSDNTVSIALDNGAKVISRAWLGYADQFNYAIDNVTNKNEWVLRIDADEVIDESTIIEIHKLSEKVLNNYNGISILRSIAYNGEVLKGAPYYKVPITRLFRSGFGRYEDRLMDEHLLIDGLIYYSDLHLIDNCLKGNTFFKNKHKNYAKLEALSYGKEDNYNNVDEFTKKRKQDRNYYYKFPIILRPFILYLYFIVFKKGILYGRNYNMFLLKQVLLYRLDVDIQILKLKYGKYI